MTHLAFELRTSTPGSLTAELAERVEASGYRSLWVNHPPDEDGLGHLATMAAATARITLGTAVVPISAVPPDAICGGSTRRACCRSASGWGSAAGPGHSRCAGWPRPWLTCASARRPRSSSARSARAGGPGPARDLVDAAIAAF